MGLRITRRRLAIGAALIVAAGWFFLLEVRKTQSVSDFNFVPLEDPAGFRRVSTGDFSSGWDPLAGIQSAPRADKSEAMRRVREDLCSALFGSEARDTKNVPIAFFTDYRCPYCRVLSDLLLEIEEEAARAIRIAWHEWPILGDVSLEAARAALAARRQGAYRAFHSRLMRSSFVPTPAYLQSLSERIGIDADQLLRDMYSRSVEREISETRALASLFRFPGTPGLIVGRTAVIGAISEAQLRALIAQEKADGPVPACAADSNS